MPLEGATVCEDGTSNCATTGADGIVNLTIVGGVDGAFTVERDGYLSVITPYNADFDGTVSVPMGSDAIVRTFAGILGVPYPFPEDAVVTVTALEPVDEGTTGLAGVTYELTSGVGNDAFYVNENTIPDLSLTATTSPAGWGGFTEVEPGIIEVDFGGTAEGCEPVGAWATDDSSRIAAPALAGFQTQAIILCE